VKFLCDQCKAKYQIADDKVAGKTVRMKCRKCGHLIEVRAAVTETSVATTSAAIDSSPPPPAGPAAPSATRPTTGASSAVKRTPLPRPAGLPPKAPLATGLAAAKPPKPAPSALAGAFKSNVQHDESSTPFDMSELSPDDTWYVAINGVPVGPIKISEVRRKAALGAVTEDSLVWQEGQDEWRPVKQLPELAAIVREAASGRSSLTPPPSRVSTPPPRSTSLSPRSTGGAAGPLSSKAPRPPAPLAGAAAARNNVVPITSRLATAERLDEAANVQPGDRVSVAPDPFAAPPVSASAAIAPPGAPSPLVASPAAAPPPEIVYRKQPPWLIIGMMVGFASFGAAMAFQFSRPAPPAPAPVIVQVPAAPTATAQPTAAPTASAAEPAPTATATTTRVAAATGPRPSGGSAPANNGRSLDLHSLAQGNNVGPGAEDPSEGPKAPGQCFSSGQVQQVIGLHQLAIRRACWERDPTTKPTVNVSVSLTIGPDGTPQGVSASGDEGSVAKCIENDVRGWHFPAMGCSQKTGFSFKFVRQ
jgi:predicted Zn finger-like uncharacterized protein